LVDKVAQRVVVGDLVVDRVDVFGRMFSVRLRPWWL
jgi:hypothetical protein